MRSSRTLGTSIATAVFTCSTAMSQPFAPRDSSGPFINWETPHVHPMDRTPDGQKLLAVNTADNRLEVFSIASGVPVRIGSVPVGLDPCSVRARGNNEAWVVNHISDTVSVVNLTTLNVVTTLRTADEPWDVVFASGPSGQRAFVSCTLRNRVLVFETADLAAAPTELTLLGEMPRAMAVNAAGNRVYVAIFESGNHSTVLGGGAVNNIGFPPNAVSRPEGPYGGVNPPPYTGTATNPPPVALIVRKNSTGQWVDGDGANWTNLVSGPQASLSGRPVGWDLYDHDVAVIDSNALSVSYADGLMNICMALAVHPVSGAITVVGTDATNHIRFEPVLNGKFLRVNFANVNATTLAGTVADLNPHLTYATSSIPQADRDRAVGDPRAIVWSSSGAAGYVAGMGSNNVVVVNSSGARLAPGTPIEVGEGPTGLVLNEAQGVLYVLNKFSATISVVNTATRAVTTTVPLFDPTPAAIKVGRKHLYDTHKNSGLGHIACASCHVDVRFDRLAWDLGEPSGVSIPVSTVNRNLGQNLIGLAPGSANPAFQPYHPMKGPMTTQTLQDIIGKEPHHWRGDRLGIEEFNGAFLGLQGDDANLTTGPTGEMQQFEDFLATVTFPPNPYRNFDNSLPTSLALPGHFSTGERSPAGTPLPIGNAVNGMAAYRSTALRLDMGAFACVTCHTLPTGAGTDMRMTGPVTTPYIAIPPGPNGERHLSLVSVDGTSNVTMKTPQLRNVYQKVGFNMTQMRNTSGFGMLHDGSVDSIERFIDEPVFNITSDQQLADLVAFMLAFSGSDLPAGSVNNALEPPGPPSRDTHAAVGVQTTAGATADTGLINSMVTQANTGKVSVVAKGLVGGRQRGYAYIGGGNWQADRQGEMHATAALVALASAGGEITFTVVPSGSQVRIGIDRDLDGYYDRNELDVCSDPADPLSRPGTVRSVDFNGDLTVGVQDLFDFLAAYFNSAADFNGDGSTTVQDIFDYLAAWFACSGG